MTSVVIRRSLSAFKWSHLPSGGAAARNAFEALGRSDRWVCRPANTPRKMGFVRAPKTRTYVPRPLSLPRLSTETAGYRSAKARRSVSIAGVGVALAVVAVSLGTAIDTGYQGYAYASRDSVEYVDANGNDATNTARRKRRGEPREDVEYG